MTREQMIDALEDYCNGNICDSCKLYHECVNGLDFSEIIDEKLKDYVNRIDEKNTDVESQNVCELEEKKMEQVKVLRKKTKLLYPDSMENVLPLKEFVNSIIEKGYKAELTKDNVISGSYNVVIYEEVEMKE